MTENVVLEGDCVEVMAGLEPGSVDAVVTDPPYDLLTTSRNGSRRINNPDNPAGRAARGFMGKTWDGTGIAFRPETWAAAYRVAKPSSYLLAFGGTRTVHRMTTAIEDAGWIIRDLLVWAYASGFPKSKASLKPAWEPIVLARKPGPLRDLAIDECRIAIPEGDEVVGGDRSVNGKGEPVPIGPGGYDGSYTVRDAASVGRWPANVILTDPIFDGDTEGVVGGGITPHVGPDAGPDTSRSVPLNGDRWEGPSGSPSDPQFYGDSGTYSRFFLIPKADRTDREPVLRTDRGVGALRDGKRETLPRRNSHPTVKPTELMRHLVRLVTPSGGLVLDPFLGSGTTAIACELEGFRWLGIEKEPEYVAIANARLNGTQRGMGLSA